jgi:hypothetical protein
MPTMMMTGSIDIAYLPLPPRPSCRQARRTAAGGPVGPPAWRGRNGGAPFANGAEFWVTDRRPPLFERDASELVQSGNAPEFLARKYL